MIEEIDKIGKLEYYKSISKDALSKYPQTFKEFVKNSEAIKVGDNLLVNGAATGYNFASESDFPITSDKPIIIYNNYIQRYDHFGELLNAMDSQRLIDNKNFRFGAKATKVVGNWGDEEPVIYETKIKRRKREVSESVEGCLILYPRSLDEALSMAGFLNRNAVKQDNITYVKGSWEIPDIRSTGYLEEVLKIAKYKVVYANYLSFGDGKLITLKRDQDILKEGWENIKILINRSLYKFIR